MTWRGFSTSDAIFLDEFQIMVATHDAGTNAPELTVFNTLTPQDRPMSSRKFSLPSQYHDKNFFIHVDQDRSLGTLNSDGPLITDPTQAILVIEITKSSHRNALLVVRVQALIDQVCSARTDARIPWDEWGRGVVVMENSPSGLGQPIYVHGTHLVMVSRMPDRGGPMDCHRVRTFDFGRRGCGALPFSDEAGGAARKALFLDGNEFVFEVGGVGNVAMLGSVGNGNFFQVSYLSIPQRRHRRLRLWQDIEELSQFERHFGRLGIDLRIFLVSTSSSGKLEICFSRLNKRKKREKAEKIGGRQLAPVPMALFTHVCPRQKE